jgi:hypothetical protein
LRALPRAHLMAPCPRIAWVWMGDAVVARRASLGGALPCAPCLAHLMAPCPRIAGGWVVDAGGFRGRDAEGPGCR